MIKRFKLAEIRRAFADYRQAEGCSCCRNTDDHQEAEERLGKLLRVPKYPDNSGYHFYKFSSEAKKQNRIKKLQASKEKA